MMISVKHASIEFLLQIFGLTFESAPRRKCTICVCILSCVLGWTDHDSGMRISG